MADNFSEVMSPSSDSLLPLTKRSSRPFVCMVLEKVVSLSTVEFEAKQPNVEVDRNKDSYFVQMSAAKQCFC